MSRPDISFDDCDGISNLLLTLLKVKEKNDKNAAAAAAAEGARSLKEEIEMAVLLHGRTDADIKVAALLVLQLRLPTVISVIGKHLKLPTWKSYSVIAV